MGDWFSTGYAHVPAEPNVDRNMHPRLNSPQILLDNGIDKDMLDPKLDNDPSVIHDRGKLYCWQGCILDEGWHRFALNVRGKYDDDWLRNKDWQIAFHGTPIENIQSILRDGYKPGEKKGPNGISVYTTPSLSLAFNYAKMFEYNGQKYHAIIENRVNCDNTQHTQIDNESNYWLSRHHSQAIRPCAILILDHKWTGKLFSLEKQCSELWKTNR
ncbi:uncharacterized protein LOC117123036 [Anneissia japonica]|uniref:uncharacterized protein LOC117123036 n=1 Tax=Anneissia japonica TaxID=1529436 RepID=UPI001425791E|nr:uncharacterized protein LOC117123036 [Anneissia japonica]